MLTWLSYPLSMTAPRPPAIPAPELTEFMSIKETLDLSYIGPDTVVTEEHLRPFLEEGRDEEALVVRFGVERLRSGSPDDFSNHCPGFGEEAARYIHKQMPNLRMIGTDVPSIACIPHLDETMEAHNEFFRRAGLEKFIIIEEMKLDKELKDIHKLVVSPWLVEGMNSGPCVIWAEI